MGQNKYTYSGSSSNNQHTATPHHKSPLEKRVCTEIEIDPILMKYVGGNILGYFARKNLQYFAQSILKKSPAHKEGDYGCIIDDTASVFFKALDVVASLSPKERDAVVERLKSMYHPNK